MPKFTTGQFLVRVPGQFHVCSIFELINCINLYYTTVKQFYYLLLSTYPLCPIQVRVSGGYRFRFTRKYFIVSADRDGNSCIKSTGTYP